jgi:PAS domain S-box-containing protein
MTVGSREEGTAEGQPGLQALIDAAPDCLLGVNAAGNIVFAGGSARRMLGYAPDELVGVALAQVLPGLAAEGGIGLRALRKEGTAVAVDVTSGALSNGDAGTRIYVLRDGRPVERALRDAESRYRSMFDQAVYGIFRCTPQGRFVDVNPALAALLGYSSVEELRGVDPASQVYCDAAEQTRLLEGHSHPGARIQGVEVQWRRKDERRVRVRLAGGPVHDEEGRLVAFEVIAEDVTQRRTLEDQILQAQRMESVGRLAGGLAHDFNNVLMAIQGYATLMLRRLAEDDPQRRYGVEIQKAAERGAALTTQMLAFSRKQVTSPRVLQLAEVIEESARMLRSLLGEDRELIVTSSPDLARVKGDRAQLEQVLMNLVVNARDAMPPGGGRVTIDAVNVRLDDAFVRTHLGVKPGDYVRLTVVDTGSGMDAATLAHIFEPFFTTKERGRGTGLGLATVYGTVRQSGGSIWVESELGRGSTFWIYLPVIHDEAEPAPPPPPRPVQMSRGSETILIVEDDPGVRETVSETLRSCGYSLLEARDVEEAARLCAEHVGTIDLLLSDVVTPGGGGGRALSEYVASLRPGLKVLYMSGYTAEAAASRGIHTSGHAFLQKPFSGPDLARVVRDLLDASPSTPPQK